MMRKVLISCLVMIYLTGCTTSEQFYTFDENDEFSIGNTVLLPIGILAIAAVAAGSGNNGGGYSNSYSNSSSADDDDSNCYGAYCYHSAAWDYLEGSGQWACRITSGYNGGQFTDDYNCHGQSYVDNWY